MMNSALGILALYICFNGTGILVGETLYDNDNDVYY